MAEPRDLPLFAWGEALRSARLRRRLFYARAVPIGFALGALTATILLPPRPRLLWNASASAPVGLYSVSPGADISPGDMVIAWLPREARRLAAQRRYLPANVPAVKQVAAGPGARICAEGAAIRIDGKLVARRRAADRLGRPLPWWHGCRVLAPDSWFLLMPDSSDSFDGRYFGSSRRAQIIGRAELLWAR